MSSTTEAPATPGLLPRAMTGLAGIACAACPGVSRTRGHSLDQDARMFFALDNAVLDASIAAWHAETAI